VVIFGLLFATTLTLVVVPILYSIMADLLSGVSRRLHQNVAAPTPQELTE
jgi:hypothetical protein